jgi:hypothetical protein
MNMTKNSFKKIPQENKHILRGKKNANITLLKILVL